MNDQRRSYLIVQLNLIVTDPFLLEAKRVLRQKCSCEATLAFFFENAFSPSVKSSNLASVDVSNVSHDAYTKRGHVHLFSEQNSSSSSIHAEKTGHLLW
jgi:hypothetical protein